MNCILSGMESRAFSFCFSSSWTAFPLDWWCILSPQTSGRLKISASKLCFSACPKWCSFTSCSSLGSALLHGSCCWACIICRMTGMNCRQCRCEKPSSVSQPGRISFSFSCRNLHITSLVLIDIQSFGKLSFFSSGFITRPVSHSYGTCGLKTVQIDRSHNPSFVLIFIFYSISFSDGKPVFFLCC